LCINYANECLQQQFNTDTFKTETEIYDSEGISDQVGAISFEDNQNVLNIIAGKGGILRMLDEEIKFGTRGSSDAFFKKMSKEHGTPEPKKGSKITALVTTKAHQTWFKIKHFAGIVKYESSGFLEKNKDTLNGEIVRLLAKSTNPLISELFATKENEGLEGQNTDAAAGAAGAESKRSGGAPPARKKKKKLKSVSSQFRSSLNELMISIQGTETHYIRCIKSNQAKMPSTFDTSYVLDQLRTGGVFSAANIRSKGYPFRKSHMNFYLYFRPLKYQMLKLKDVTVNNNDDEMSIRTFCTSIIADMNEKEHLQKNDILIGSSMVLYKASVNIELETLRSTMIEVAFQEIDTNNTGLVPLSSLSTLLVSLNLNQPTEETISEFANDNDTISFDSLRKLIDSKRV
jgi:myosin V